MPQAMPRAGSDRARVLHAHPDLFIDAAVLLEALLPMISIAHDGRTVRLDAAIPIALADALAAWGADLTDIEDGRDAEEEAAHE